METIPIWFSLYMYFTCYFHGFQKIKLFLKTHQLLSNKMHPNNTFKMLVMKKVSWYWKFKIIFKYLRSWIDVFILRFLHRKGEIHTCSSAQLIIRPGKIIFSYHSSSPLNTICMPFHFILQVGFARRMLKEKTIKISRNYIRGQPKKPS